jgi:ABC-type Fe3+ transport system permease subunit
LGLCLAFVPGVMGLLLAYAELRSIERGDTPRAGREWARAGVVLGWMNVGMAVAAGLVLAWIGLHQG